jgi:hypothetical protein
MLDRQQIERIGLEEALRRMPAGVMVVEASSGRILFANREAQENSARLLGRSIPSELED